MEIYVLRHGQTDYNVAGKFQGQIDIKLNEVGIEQAKKASNNLKNIEFDLVISSPLSRALETAEIVANNKKIAIENRLIERSFGKLEGQISVPNYEQDIEKYEIESNEELFKRVYEFLDELKIQYSDNNKKVLLVTHEGIAQVIQCYFEGIPKKDMLSKYRLKNAEYKKYIV